MSRLLIRVLALASIVELCILCLQPIVRPAGASPPYPGYALDWSDEFNGTALDLTRWAHIAPGKRHQAYNVPDAISVGGGLLTITTYTSHDSNYTGMIATENKYMTGYGYMEARIAFYGSPGMWSSFFVQSPTVADSSNFNPRRDGTEMDIVEHRVHDRYDNDISGQIPSAVIWDGTYNGNKSVGSCLRGSGLNIGYHIYGLQWTPSVMNFFIDSAYQWSVPNAPDILQDPPGFPPCSPAVTAPVSQRTEFFTLCSEVWDQGDTTWCGSIPAGGYGSLSSNSTSMRVDYVRHYVLAPAAPSGLMATPLSGNKINLAWTEGSSYAEAGFKVERSVDGVNFSEIGTAAADSLKYQDAPLTPPQTLYYYYYRVRAFNNAGNSAYSNTASARTDVVKPAVVTNLSVSIIGKLTMAVNWTAPGDDGINGKATQYGLRFSKFPITAANFDALPDSVKFAVAHGSGYPECRLVSGLSACTTYYFAIKTMDAAGNRSGISNVPNAQTQCAQNIVAECVLPDADSVAPADVTDLSVPSVGTLAVALSWTAPGDDGTTGKATEYDLRCSRSPITASNFGSAPRIWGTGAPRVAGFSECRLVSGLVTCTPYYFAIKTKDEWGNWSGISNVPNATTVCGSNRTPECVLGLSQRSVPNDEGVLSFSPPSPNPARGPTSFRISVPGDLQGAKLRVQVFDLAGRRVRSLVDRIASQGPSQFDWNLLDDSGQGVAAALYMVRVEIGDTRKTFPLVVLR